MRKILLLLSLLGSISAPAQEMLKLDVEELNKSIISSIEQLNDYIFLMSDGNKTLQTRNLYKEKALKLFIGEGKPYEDVVLMPDGNTQKIKKEGAIIEVSTSFRRNPTRRLVRDYFTALINTRFKPVNVIGVDMISGIDEKSLRMISKNIYVVKGWTESVFNGFREGKAIYRDVTRRESNIYIIVDEMGMHPMLNDVVATEINTVK